MENVNACGQKNYDYICKNGYGNNGSRRQHKMLAEFGDSDTIRDFNISSFPYFLYPLQWMHFTFIIKKISVSAVSPQPRFPLKKTKTKKRILFSANLVPKGKDKLWVHERRLCFMAGFPAVLLSKASPLKTWQRREILVAGARWCQDSSRGLERDGSSPRMSKPSPPASPGLEPGRRYRGP